MKDILRKHLGNLVTKGEGLKGWRSQRWLEDFQAGSVALKQYSLK